MIRLTRRLLFGLPLLLSACGDDEPDDATYFEPLHYGYLPPIQLTVAAIEIEQRFVPAGVAPDISASDPVSAVGALRAMANERLQALGTTNQAAFAILDASITRSGDTIRSAFAVSLTIYDADRQPLGFAQAHVDRSHSGDIPNLRRTLYDVTKATMDDMNVEFEYQVRKNLKAWLTTSAAPDTPVEQAPLDRPTPQ